MFRRSRALLCPGNAAGFRQGWHDLKRGCCQPAMQPVTNAAAASEEKVLDSRSAAHNRAHNRQHGDGGGGRGSRNIAARRRRLCSRLVSREGGQDCQHAVQRSAISVPCCVCISSCMHPCQAHLPPHSTTLPAPAPCSPCTWRRLAANNIHLGLHAIHVVVLQGGVRAAACGGAAARDAACETRERSGRASNVNGADRGWWR